MIQGNPHLSFDAVIAKIDVGTKCTACMLDLEHEYVTAYRDHIASPASDTTTGGSAAAKPPLRRRVFAWLDAISPPVPYDLCGHGPVLAGPDVEQRMWVSHAGMFFENASMLSALTLVTVVRDAEGRVAYKERRRIEPGESAAIDVSRPLLCGRREPGTDLIIGSVYQRWVFRKPSLRGATRPHMEILTARGSCAVHSQRYIGPIDRWWHFRWRPHEHRMLFTVVNESRAELRVEFTYFPRIEGAAEEPYEANVTVPPFGSRIHETVFPADLSDRWSGAPIDVRVRPDGANKIHAICATPNLDCMSIDHF